MRILTSFSPSRIEHQQWCVQTWLKAGCSVTAVQTAGESDVMKPHFPNVEFTETNLVGDVFGKPYLPRIAAFFQLVKDEPALLLNSDIEIVVSQKRFEQDYLFREKTLVCGVRWDMHPRTKVTKPIRFGIDAFLLTPEIAENTPDVGMTIGVPVWDYWLPYHCVTRLGMKLITNKSQGLRHVVHPQNWSMDEMPKGFAITQEHYGVGMKEMTEWIIRQTGRTRLKHPVWKL